MEIPNEGPMCDLVWSEPEDIEGWGLVPRGYSYTFGEDITQKFLQDNKSDLIIRSHQLVMEGYSFKHDNKLITVYSASNFCDRCGNQGALIEIDEKLEKKFKTFDRTLIK